VIIPLVELPPATPSTDHVTASFDNPTSDALKVNVPAGATVEDGGEIEKVKTETVEVPERVESLAVTA
jgi:hypothetical protein